MTNQNSREVRYNSSAVIYTASYMFLVDCSLLPPQELQVQLQTALKEVDDLCEARERQKEMVFADVKQRDMYQTLLAQSTL